MLLNIFQMFSELICSQKKERRENKELERKESTLKVTRWSKVGVSKGRERGTVKERENSSF